MLKKHESQTIEFKEIWKDEYLKTICAFANTDGGNIYIGIGDDGRPVRVENIKVLVEKLPNKINNRLGLLIDLIVENIDGNEIINIKIDKTYAPISFNGKFFKRSGSNTIELNGSNLTNFLLKKYGKTWDDVLVEEFSVSDINTNTIEDFKKWATDRIPSIKEETDLLVLLEKLNLYDGKYFKRAAVMLFGKNPQKYFIQSHSKIGKFLSDSELLTSDIIEGNLFEQLERIVDILRTKYLHSYISYEGLNRIETLEYPYEALREAIINALIHRDYTDTSVLQIRVYEEKIVFSNGATLSSEVPIEKFKENHISKPFNPLIANLFYKAGFVESWGKGTNNMIADCIKMNMLEPRYEYVFNALKVTFFKTTPKTTPKTTQELLIDYIIENKDITREELANKLNISVNGVKQHILKLKKENILKRIGGRKIGYWEIAEGNIK